MNGLQTQGGQQNSKHTIINQLQQKCIVKGNYKSEVSSLHSLVGKKTTGNDFTVVCSTNFL